MWTEAHALWKTRNEQVHNPDNTLQRQDLEQQLSELYNQEDQVLAEDRNIFSMSLQDRIRQQSQQLHDFIQIHQPTIAHSIREQITRANANVRRLTEYFRPR